jgi:hypothetical protein
MDWIEFESKALWNSKKQKTAVFAHHEEIRKELSKRFPHAIMIGGKTPPKKRSEVIAKLSSEKNTDVYLGILSNQACGQGINLTSAVTLLVILEQDDTAGVDAQIQDRAWRMGAKYPIRIAYLLGLGTLDERQFEKVAKRYDITSEIIGGDSKRRKINSVIEIPLPQAPSEVATTTTTTTTITFPDEVKSWLKLYPRSTETFNEYIDRAAIFLNPAHSPLTYKEISIALTLGETMGELSEKQITKKWILVKHSQQNTPELWKFDPQSRKDKLPLPPKLRLAFITDLPYERIVQVQELKLWVHIQYVLQHEAKFWSAFVNDPDNEECMFY